MLKLISLAFLLGTSSTYAATTYKCAQNSVTLTFQDSNRVHYKDQVFYGDFVNTGIAETHSRTPGQFIGFSGEMFQVGGSSMGLSTIGMGKTTIEGADLGEYYFVTNEGTSIHTYCHLVK